MAFRKLRWIGDAVMIRHSLFSLPFAAIAFLLESGGRPPLDKAVWVLLAVIGARNAANALNRIIDEGIDALNPRTAGRHLPSGLLKRKDLLVFTAVSGGLFVVATAMLNTLCLLLLPLALAMIFAYSYTKRFTWLCHYFLGLTCAIAPMGSFLALSGRFELRYFFLAGAVALWVAGFDIIYALQDIEFDKKEGLHSIPARFGKKGALLWAKLSHLGTLAGFAALPCFWQLSWIYWIGFGAVLALLAAEHVVVSGGTERHIRIASYSINEVLGLVLLAFTAADIYF